MTRATVGWCLYDLANTVFVFNMTTYHFPVWVIVDRGGSELAYGLAYGGSMLASAALMPWVGRRTDTTARRLPTLAGWTIACAGLTASLSFTTPVTLALVLFALANVCYQLALVSYNTLLPAVAAPHRLGRVSGYGVAWGYVGNVVGVLATVPLVHRWGRQAAFWPTALLFLLLAIPAFRWIPEPAAAKPADAAAWRAPRVMRSPAVRGLLLSTFWSLNAVSALLAFIAVYATQAIGFSERQLQQFLLMVTAAAALGAVACGRLADRHGSLRTLWWIWAVWAGLFLALVFDLSSPVFWMLGGVAGVALGGTWVTSRVALVTLARRAQLGEAFGLFGVVLSLSAIVGPVVWGAIVRLGAAWGPARYHLAMASLFLLHLIGWGWYHATMPAMQRAAHPASAE